MNDSVLRAQQQTALAFDGLAEHYDDLFTRSIVGRMQRNAVWEVLAEVFNTGDRVLELNCGTGEDAIFLSRRGVSVLACDTSERMVEVARRRVVHEVPEASVRVELLATEQINTLQETYLFDGVLSNFSGLNCVADLEGTARCLSLLVKVGAPLVLCLSTRFCLFEILWFLLHGRVSTAFRRTSGHAVAQVEGFDVTLRYPTLRELCRIFSPSFELVSCRGVGIAVPPSYAEAWACNHPRTLNLLQAIEGQICDWPGFRVMGDHLLVCFERVSS